MKIEAPVGKANELFNAQFSAFRHIDSGEVFVRTLQYSVPADLEGLIKAVHPTTSYVCSHCRFGIERLNAAPQVLIFSS